MSRFVFSAVFYISSPNIIIWHCASIYPIVCDFDYNKIENELTKSPFVAAEDPKKLSA